MKIFKSGQTIPNFGTKQPWEHLIIIALAFFCMTAHHPRLTQYKHSRLTKAPPTTETMTSGRGIGNPHLLAASASHRRGPSPYIISGGGPVTGKFPAYEGLPSEKIEEFLRQKYPHFPNFNLRRVRCSLCYGGLRTLH